MLEATCKSEVVRGVRHELEVGDDEFLDVASISAEAAHPARVISRRRPSTCF
jgi:hypothetical protein